jgi:hypothetical protein
MNHFVDLSVRFIPGSCSTGGLCLVLNFDSCLNSASFASLRLNFFDQGVTPACCISVPGNVIMPVGAGLVPAI